MPGHENSSWLGVDIYFGSFEVSNFISNLYMGIVVLLVLPNPEEVGVSARKQNKTKLNVSLGHLLQPSKKARAG